MDVYRLYFLDPRSGRIRGFHEFEAEHDAAAIEKAERMRVDDPMELWCHARKVEQWPSLLMPILRESAS